jgi:hypothetical protein
VPRGLLEAAVVVLAAGLGFLGWRLLDGSAGDDGPRAERRANPAGAFAFDAARLDDPPVLAGDGGPVAAPAGAGAATPAAAVEAFLAAEVAADRTGSYALLSAADRAEYRSVEKWRQRHADLPAVTGFAGLTLGPAGGERTEVTADVTLNPVLDPVLGAVPAEATATWVAVREDGRWWVSLGESRLDARWPSDESAPAAVEQWVTARIACGDSRTTGELETGLVGSPALAEPLCGTEAGDPVDIGPAEPLDRADAASVIAAFGEAATGWARLVEVRSPIPLRLAVGPLGDGWVVIGVLPPST